MSCHSRPLIATAWQPHRSDSFISVNSQDAACSPSSRLWRLRVHGRQTGLGLFLSPGWAEGGTRGQVHPPAHTHPPTYMSTHLQRTYTFILHTCFGTWAHVHMHRLIRTRAHTPFHTFLHRSTHTRDSPCTCLFVPHTHHDTPCVHSHGT